MRIQSKLDCSSEQFLSNIAHHEGLCAELLQRTEKAKQGGGSATLEKLRQQGKLAARDRIQKLIDPSSEFLELSNLAGHELYETEVPSGGIVTGIGMVHGRPCMIVANDASVKGGTYFPITVKKHLRA